MHDRMSSGGSKLPRYDPHPIVGGYVGLDHTKMILLQWNV